MKLGVKKFKFTQKLFTGSWVVHHRQMFFHKVLFDEPSFDSLHRELIVRLNVKPNYLCRETSLTVPLLNILPGYNISK